MAQVIAPVGLRGDLRIRWLTDAFVNLAAGRTVRVGPLREPRLVERSVLAERGQVKLAGIDSRTEAATLRGALLTVDVQDAAPLPPGRFYRQQVLGAHVVTLAGEALGPIVDIFETGSNDVYVVATPAGELLIPAIPDVVQEFDVATHVLTVELIPGLR